VSICVAVEISLHTLVYTVCFMSGNGE